MQLEKSNQLLARRQNAVAKGVGIYNTATVVKADGAIITDEDGNELIDFAGGIGVVNAGHCPPTVVEAIVNQAQKYIHTSFNVVTYAPYVELCEQLIEILPHGGPTKAMLISTGAEAVENAIKIARQSTGKQGVLCFTDAYHGRTLMAMSLTSSVSYQTDCGPFAPEVYRLPFPNYYRYGTHLSEEEFVDQELRRLEESTKNLVDPKNLAAIIIEIVQGEGGFNIAPERYLAGLRQFCDKYGIILIFDEIQSGFGRTGYWASWQRFGIIPDLSTYAKSMGSGMPIAAVVGKASVMDAAGPGTIGGTYIGNPLCCVAASATIDLMKKIDLNQRARQVGQVISNRLHSLQQRYSNYIGDVRTLGAMCALEFVVDGNPAKPLSTLTSSIVKKCAEQGLIILSAGTHKNVIRILSPLIIEEDLLERGLDILEKSIVDQISA